VFKDRIFNLSVLFSGAWHLFWVCVIGIVITPTVQPSNLYQEINFLGPILEKTAFDMMTEGRKPLAETVYARSALFIDNVYLKPAGPKRKVLKTTISETVRDKLTLILLDDIKGAKETPSHYEEDIRMFYRGMRPATESPPIEGPAAERKIIFKPDRLLISPGIYGDDEEYVVKIRFLVSHNGIVYNAEPVVSSGYPEVDLQAMSFLKKWRFNPGNSAKDEVSWGIMTVNAKAR